MKIKTILYSLIINFLLILTFFLIPSEAKNQFFFIVAILGLLFLISGVILIIKSKKQKGKLKIFLQLTGYAAISPLVFTILHNLFYALSMIFTSLSFVFEVLHGTSFIISLIIAPIAFLVGVIGSFILLKK
jgi:hypothetical protein